MISRRRIRSCSTGGRHSSRRNETYQLKLYCPGFVTIGDDGGGMQLLLPLAGGPVSILDAGALGSANATHVADDFAGWLAAGCPLPDDEGNEVPPLTAVCIYLESRPASLKSLLMIKEQLGLQTSIGELKRSVDSVPCLIADQYTYAKVRTRCAKVNTLDPCLGIRLASDRSVQLPWSAANKA